MHLSPTHFSARKISANLTNSYSDVFYITYIDTICILPIFGLYMFHVRSRSGIRRANANFSAYARILCSVSIIVFYELTESSSDFFGYMAIKNAVQPFLTEPAIIITDHTNYRHPLAAFSFSPLQAVHLPLFHFPFSDISPAAFSFPFCRYFTCRFFIFNFLRTCSYYRRQSALLPDSYLPPEPADVQAASFPGSSGKSSTAPRNSFSHHLSYR